VAKLLSWDLYKDCPIPGEDPIRFYYVPVIKRFYHRRIDLAMNLIGTGKRVLEIGYGSGTSLLELNSRFDEVHGVDLHQYGSWIRNVFAEQQIAVNLVRASILEPPYPAGYFNAIIAISILEHLSPSDLPKVMSQVHRLLSPGGVFVVGMPGLNPMMTTAFKFLRCDIKKYHFSAPKQALDEATKVFIVEKVFKQPFFAHDSFLIYEWFRAKKT
jgi:cyclopropane fatty-acyl-phospholipid synthase-like methyltransferase